MNIFFPKYVLSNCSSLHTNTEGFDFTSSQLCFNGVTRIHLVVGTWATLAHPTKRFAKLTPESPPFLKCSLVVHRHRVRCPVVDVFNAWPLCRWNAPLSKAKATSQTKGPSSCKVSEAHWEEHLRLSRHGGTLNLPSGKRLHNYGKSQFSMGKSTISTGSFSIAMLNYQRVRPPSTGQHVFSFLLNHLGFYSSQLCSWCLFHMCSMMSTILISKLSPKIKLY